MNSIILAYLVSIVHPLTILKIKSYIFLCFILLSPFLLQNIHSADDILYLQLVVLIVAPTGYPAVSVFFMHFPIFKRFTYASFTYALSRALMYCISSFGIVILVKYYGNIGLMFIMLPIIFAYFWGVGHFIKLEKEAGNYHPLLKNCKYP